MRLSQLAPRLSTTYTRNSSVANGASVGLSANKVVCGLIADQANVHLQLQDGGGTWRNIELGNGGGGGSTNANVGLVGFSLPGSAKVRLNNGSGFAADCEWFWWKTS